MAFATFGATRMLRINRLCEGHFELARTLAVIMAPSYFGWLRDPRIPHEQGRFWFGAARQKLFEGFTAKL